ncbi:MAG TPA: hypothetical protein VMT66_03675 [Steroidobacteraceae bacterium]|nr:hypothetical protein [Steroidobacteraceae bacterium]
MTVLKELSLLGRANEMASERSGSHTALSIELAKLRDGALNDAPANAHALN